jgi:hypothetical protein
MEQITETIETIETIETKETNIICPTCNKQQITIINVKICEAENSIWNKCSITQKCPLFQIKNKNK